MIRLRLSFFVCALVCAASAATATAADIVLYASDATTIRGNWTRVSDASAAGGQYLGSADNGWSSANTPLASPTDYFEIPFTAAANTTYHVWFRLRASANSKYNDSIWVQYSDARQNGSAVYAIGSSTALAVNLENCSGCGVSGWGWQDGAYWLSQATSIQFSTTGTHTLRVQIREDGVQLDQVVLSSSAYLSSAPGSVTNDGTIVPKPSSSTGGSGTSPYLGTATAIPGTIKPENFDNGGAGVAYYDTTSGNSGGAYRSSDVDIEGASTGGYDIGWTAAGEWLKYSVNVASSGTYTITFNVASNGQGGTFHLEMNGTNVTGSLTIPNTGGWQNWKTVSASATLNAGAQVARLVVDSAPSGAAGNFGPIQFTAAASGGGGGGTPSALAYLGSPVALPGHIEAENFDTGGAGTSYSDTTSGNAGGAYRSTDVDIEPSSEGGYDVGWTAGGEYLNYSVTVAAAGQYTAQLRVASPNGGGSLHIGFNGPSNVWTTVPIPATGGWQTWTTVNVPVTLGAGPQLMTLLFDTSGFNVNYVDVVSSSTPAPSSSGNTITVPSGGDLQSALNNAQPGDTILLVPGATYVGPFVLPAKGGSSYITIRSSAPDSSLPADGVRITPAYASQLPRVQGGVAGMPAFTTATSAHHYRLQFLEIMSTYAWNNLIELGDGSANQTSLSQVAHDLIVDRCYLHGDPTNGQKRGIALNSASTSIVNSYFSDIKSTVDDAQAIAGWNGPGPYTIVNNYLEAAGDNIIFGGSDPTIANLVPSDITIRRNYITKQTSWRGSGWTVKNLIELKNAQRVTIDTNLIENNWAAAQQGQAILFTPRNQSGTAPWSVVQQISVTNNIVRHVAGVFNLLGSDYNNPSQPTNNITIRNNLFYDVNTSWGGAGRLFESTGTGAYAVVLDHNTLFSNGTSEVWGDTAPVNGFSFTNNIIPDNQWAVMGTGTAEGTATLIVYYPGATFVDNVIIAGNTNLYPANNYFPPDQATVQFNSDYSLSSSSPYRYGATDGTMVGADTKTLWATVPQK